MSLDVFLKMPGGRRVHGSGIYIREAGATREITREEWDARHPGVEPFIAAEDTWESASDEVYSANITHNLNTMAKEAGIYKELWCPEELGITKAKELIEPLTIGLRLLQSDPKRFKQYNPDNGWGSYETLVNFVLDYLSACVHYPEADVKVWG